MRYLDGIQKAIRYIAAAKRYNQMIKLELKYFSAWINSNSIAE